MARTLKATEVRVQGRLSFAHVIDVDKNDKYSTSILIPKTDKTTIKKIYSAVDAAIKAGSTKLAGKDGKVNVRMLKLPMRDADEEGNDNPGYAGMMFFNASSTRRPQVVNRRLEPITDSDEIYSGCYANVMINFYAFAVDGNKGIAASLGNIQKVRDGERFGFGGTSAEDDFDELDDEDDFENEIDEDNLPL